jgi:hypothetical protein
MLAKTLAALRVALRHALALLLALVVLFEEWGWRPLAALAARLARFRVVARLEAAIAALPPYAALAVFATPTLLLFPLKLVAMWLLAKGQVVAASGLFVAAKVASTALVARLFMLTRASLMRIGWFARAYNWFVPWKEALFAEIRASWPWRYGRMVKTRVKLAGQRAWARLKVRLAPTIARFKSAARETAAQMRALGRRLSRAIGGAPRG